VIAAGAPASDSAGELTAFLQNLSCIYGIRFVAEKKRRVDIAGWKGEEKNEETGEGMERKGRR